MLAADVVVEAPVHWWDVAGAFGPFAVLAAALIAGVIAWRGNQRRADAAAKSEWWRRAQWAFDAATSNDPDRQNIGLGMLRILAQSDLAGAEEAAIIALAWAGPLAGVAGVAGVADAAASRTAVRAARLRIATDAAQGIETPDWIRTLAGTDL